MRYIKSRRNKYTRKTKKQKRTAKRRQRRFFSKKQRKQSGGGIPGDNITKGFTKETIVAPVEVDSDGYSDAPTMRMYGDYINDQD
jgi:hypothetical protein